MKRSLVHVHDVIELIYLNSLRGEDGKGGRASLASSSKASFGLGEQQPELCTAPGSLP